MGQSSAVCIGRIKLKNPIICSSGEHVMSATGIERALLAGVSAVVVKSTNESAAAKAQIKKTDYLSAVRFFSLYHRSLRDRPPRAIRSLHRIAS